MEETVRQTGIPDNGDPFEGKEFDDAVDAAAARIAEEIATEEALEAKLKCRLPEFPRIEALEVTEDGNAWLKANPEVRMARRLAEFFSSMADDLAHQDLDEQERGVQREQVFAAWHAHESKAPREALLRVLFSALDRAARTVQRAAQSELERLKRTGAAPPTGEALERFLATETERAIEDATVQTIERFEKYAPDESEKVDRAWMRQAVAAWGVRSGAAGTRRRGKYQALSKALKSTSLGNIRPNSLESLYRGKDWRRSKEAKKNRRRRGGPHKKT